MQDDLAALLSTLSEVSTMSAKLAKRVRARNPKLPVPPSVLGVVVRYVPHREQRYETVGDWWVGAAGETVVTVSRELGGTYGLLVAVHELVEARLCAQHGVSEAVVTAFDREFEEARLRGEESPLGGQFRFRDQYVDFEAEPGDCPVAPYYREHQAATVVERALAGVLGVHWPDYEEACAALSQTDAPAPADDGAA